MLLHIHYGCGKPADVGGVDLEEIVVRSLDRFSHRLKQVYLYLDDVNGPRGGVDKQCRCVLQLHRMPPVVIRDQDASLVTLIYRVANRAAYALSQKSDERNKRLHQNPDARRWTVNDPTVDSLPVVSE